VRARGRAAIRQGCFANPGGKATTRSPCTDVGRWAMLT
jgi:hypothetical protein